MWTLYYPAVETQKNIDHRVKTLHPHNKQTWTLISRDLTTQDAPLLTVTFQITQQLTLITRTLLLVLQLHYQLCRWRQPYSREPVLWDIQWHNHHHSCLIMRCYIHGLCQRVWCPTRQRHFSHRPHHNLRVSYLFCFYCNSATITLDYGLYLYTIFKTATRKETPKRIFTVAVGLSCHKAALQPSL